MHSHLPLFVLLGTLFQGCLSDYYQGLLQSYCKNPVHGEKSHPSYLLMNYPNGVVNFSGKNACERCFLSAKNRTIYAGPQKIGNYSWYRYAFESTKDCDVSTITFTNVPYFNWDYRLLKDLQPPATVRGNHFVPSPEYDIIESDGFKLLLLRGLKPEKFNTSAAAIIKYQEKAMISGFDWAPPVGDFDPSWVAGDYYRNASQDVYFLNTLDYGYGYLESRTFLFVTSDRLFYQIQDTDSHCKFEVKSTNGKFSAVRLGGASKPVFKFENGAFIETGAHVEGCSFYVERMPRFDYLKGALIRGFHNELLGIFVDGEVRGDSSYYVGKASPHGTFFAHDYEGTWFFSDGRHIYMDRGSVESLDGYQVYYYDVLNRIRTNCRGSQFSSIVTIHNDTSVSITRDDGHCESCAIDASEMHNYGLVKVYGKNVFYIVGNKVAVKSGLAPHCKVGTLGLHKAWAQTNAIA